MYSIGKFSKETGISISTLRRWDKENIYKPTFVTEGGTLSIDTNTTTRKQFITGGPSCRI